MAAQIILRIPINDSTVIEIYFNKNVNLKNLSKNELEIISQAIGTLILNLDENE
jgi:hypothetical protein